MPYFAKYNSTFIHIPKNAGTFVSLNLGLKKEWDMPRKSESKLNLYKLKIKNFYKSFKNKSSFFKEDDFEKIEHIYGYKIGSFALQHATLSEMISLGLIDIEVVKNSYCFCIKRSPFDRINSIYKYWNFSTKYTFDEFVSNIIDLKFRYLNLELTHSMRTHLRPQVDFIRLEDGSFPNWVDIIDIKNLNLFWQNNVQFRGWPKLATGESKILNSTEKNKIKMSLNSEKIIRKTYEVDFEYFGYN
jgi:hypothetical protein